VTLELWCLLNTSMDYGSGKETSLLTLYRVSRKERANYALPRISIDTNFLTDVYKEKSSLRQPPLEKCEENRSGESQSKPPNTAPTQQVRQEVKQEVKQKVEHNLFTDHNAMHSSTLDTNTLRWSTWVHNGGAYPVTRLSAAKSVPNLSVSPNCEYWRPYVVILL